MKRFIGGMLFLLTLALGAGQVLALDDELKLGQAIFQQYCAACHGATGEGDGPLANLFKVKPRALSQLSKENDGEYPFELVYRTLKATEPDPAHGAPAMPVWGNYFMVEQALSDPSIDNSKALIAVGRLLSVVYYIETLQEE
jgi:mono/diheme cytochrome c family protein